MPELSPASYVVLGMINIGARSGYEIKRTAEISTRFFWALSPVQVYTELKRLEQQKLVKGRDDPRGSRRRRVYSLTPRGRSALRAWVADGSDLGREMRDKGLLKLFFADILDRRQALELVRAMRERAEGMTERFEREILPVAEWAADPQDIRFPLIAARFGHDFELWVTQWCRSLERELQSPRKRARRPQ